MAVKTSWHHPGLVPRKASTGKVQPPSPFPSKLVHLAGHSASLSACILQRRRRHTQTDTHARTRPRACTRTRAAQTALAVGVEHLFLSNEIKMTKLQQSHVSRGKPSALVLFSPHWSPFAPPLP